MGLLDLSYLYTIRVWLITHLPIALQLFFLIDKHLLKCSQCFEINWRFILWPSPTNLAEKVKTLENAKKNIATKDGVLTHKKSELEKIIADTEIEEKELNK